MLCGGWGFCEEQAGAQGGWEAFRRSCLKPLVPGSSGLCWGTLGADSAAVLEEGSTGLGGRRLPWRPGQGQRGGEPRSRQQGCCQVTATGSRVRHSLQAW